MAPGNRANSLFEGLNMEKEELMAEVCRNYCKYPQIVHEEWLRGEIEDWDRDEYLVEKHCNDCPLTKL